MVESEGPKESSAGHHDHFKFKMIDMHCNCGKEGQKVAYVCKGSMGVCPDYIK